LILNRDVPGLQHRLENDAFMKGMLFPAAFRIVLETLVAAHDDEGDDEEDIPPWQSEWLKFCQETLGIASAPPTDAEEQDKWVEEAVDRFSSEYGFVKEIRKQEEAA